MLNKFIDVRFKIIIYINLRHEIEDRVVIFRKEGHLNGEHPV